MSPNRLDADPFMVKSNFCLPSHPFREILNQLVDMVADFRITPVLFIIGERCLYSLIV
jgi:hypothetical protein